MGVLGSSTATFWFPVGYYTNIRPGVWCMTRETVRMAQHVYSTHWLFIGLSLSIWSSHTTGQQSFLYATTSLSDSAIESISITCIHYSCGWASRAVFLTLTEQKTTTPLLGHWPTWGTSTNSLGTQKPDGTRSGEVVRREEEKKNTKIGKNEMQKILDMWLLLFCANTIPYLPFFFLEGQIRTSIKLYVCVCLISEPLIRASLFNSWSSVDKLLDRHIFFVLLLLYTLIPFKCVLRAVCTLCQTRSSLLLRGDSGHM